MDTAPSHRDAVAASTFDDLIETIPAPYRPVLRSYLLKKYRTARRRKLVALTMRSYRRHMRKGTFPYSIRNAIKVPPFPVADEFLPTPQYTSTTIALHAGVIAARAAALKNAISQKTAELSFLSTLCGSDRATWEKDWRKLVLGVASGLALAYDGRLVRDEAGSWSLSGIPRPANADFVATLNGRSVYMGRMLSLAGDDCQLRRQSKDTDQSGRRANRKSK